VQEIKDYVSEPYFNTSSPSDDELDQEEDSSDDASDSGEEVTTNVATAPTSALNDSDNAGGHDDDGHGDGEPSAQHQRVPHVARARSNLTALSQHYNVRRCFPLVVLRVEAKRPTC